MKASVGPSGPLLAAPFLRIRLQQLLRRSDQICALVPPVDHHLTVQGVGMKRVVQQQQDRISFLHLAPERLQLLRAEQIVGIVHRHEIDPADQARRKAQVVPDVPLHQRQAVELVRLILDGFTDIFAEFMVSGRKK